MKHSRQGFIALTSMLIVMAMILLITTTVALTAFFTRGGASAAYYKEVSRALAESCIQKSMLELSEDPAYAGGEVLTVATSSFGNDTCNIISVASSSGQKIISARAVFQDTVTNIRATVDGEDLTVTGWEEPARF